MTGLGQYDKHYLVSLRKGVKALYDSALLFFFANMLSSKNVTSLECSLLGELGPAPHSSSKEQNI